MSENQNESQNSGTIKPVVHKTNLRVNRPSTEGYQKDEIIEQNTHNQAKPSLSIAKPSLNLSASVYIPKSFSGSTSTTNATSTPVAEKPTQTANVSNVTQTNMLNTNTQPFTPKMNNYNPNMNMNNPMNPIGQNYNMGQSNFFLNFLFFYKTYLHKEKNF